MKKLCLLLVLILMMSGCTAEGIDPEALEDLESEVESLEEDVESFEETILALEADKENLSATNETLLNDQIKYQEEITALEDEMTEVVNSSEDLVAVDFETLFSNLYINDFTTNHSGTMGTFIVSETILEDTFGDLYGTYLYYEGSLRKIDRGGTRVTWSPDDNYLMLDDGYSVLRSGAVYDVVSSSFIASFTYLLDVYWINETHLVMTRPNESVLLDDAIEVEHTTDLVVVDVITGDEEVLLTGDSDYFIELTSVEGEMITVHKVFVGESSDKEDVILTVKY